MNGFAYIRSYYGVPAKKGQRVYYRHANKYGTIVGTSNAHLRIRLDGEKHIGTYHPTWELDYLDMTMPPEIDHVES